MGSNVLQRKIAVPPTQRCRQPRAADVVCVHISSSHLAKAAPPRAAGDAGACPSALWLSLRARAGPEMLCW
jgi:hypothetical protein